MENRYHRHLNLSKDYIPNVNFSQWSTKNLKKWYDFHETISMEELNNNTFTDWLKSKGMISTWIEVFYTPPGEDGIIHSDNVDYLEWAKIIFRYGAEESTMRWWESNTTKEYHSDYGHSVLVTSQEFAKLVHESKIEVASLVNVGLLHSSHNPTTEGRFTVTVALFDIDGNRILWDDALKKLSDCVL